MSICFVRCQLLRITCRAFPSALVEAKGISIFHFPGSSPDDHIGQQETFWASQLIPGQLVEVTAKSSSVSIIATRKAGIYLPIPVVGQQETHVDLHVGKVAACEDVDLTSQKSYGQVEGHAIHL